MNAISTAADQTKATPGDATRFIVLEFGNGDSIPTAFKALAAFDNEPAARKAADDYALQSPGTHFGVYQKTGTCYAKLEAKWKGCA